MKSKNKKPKTPNAKKPSKRAPRASNATPSAAPKEATTPTPTTSPSTTSTPSTSDSTSDAPTLTFGALAAIATLALVEFGAETLRLALQFVLKVCPKEGPFSHVVFDVDDAGVPLVAAHDKTRCHIAYLPSKAWCLARGTVALSNAKQLHKNLKALDDNDKAKATVKISAAGRVEINRTEQPPLPHRLDFKTLEPGLWQPPRDDGYATSAPLVLPSEQLRKSVQFPDAVIRIEQRTSARAILNVELGGEVVARAIIAEQGHELYPSEPPAQTTFPFSEGKLKRSSPAVPESVQRAADELRAKLQGRHEPHSEVKVSATEQATSPRDPVADGKHLADKLIEAVQVFPEPGEKPVVVEIPDEVFDTLSPEGIESLRLPPGITAPLFWFNLPDRRTSPVLAGAMARAVATACATLGLVCADVSAGRRHGVECSVWTVSLPAQNGGA